MGMLGNYEDNKDAAEMERLQRIRQDFIARFGREPGYQPEQVPGGGMVGRETIPADMANWLQILQLIQRQKRRAQEK